MVKNHYFSSRTEIPRYVSSRASSQSSSVVKNVNSTLGNAMKGRHKARRVMFSLC